MMCAKVNIGKDIILFPGNSWVRFVISRCRIANPQAASLLHTHTAVLGSFRNFQKP